jgi:hypothetical protein
VRRGGIVSVPGVYAGFIHGAEDGFRKAAFRLEADGVNHRIDAAMAGGVVDNPAPGSMAQSRYLSSIITITDSTSRSGAMARSR